MLLGKVRRCWVMLVSVGIGWVGLDEVGTGR